VSVAEDVDDRVSTAPPSDVLSYPSTQSSARLSALESVVIQIQESLAHAKVSARQQCVHEGL